MLLFELPPRLPRLPRGLDEAGLEKALKRFDVPPREVPEEDGVAKREPKEEVPVLFVLPPRKPPRDDCPVEPGIVKPPVDGVEEVGPKRLRPPVFGVEV